MASDPSAFFRDMLGQWEKLARQVAGDAPKSAEFARAMGGTGDATTVMQAMFRQGVENAFAAADLPTRKDFDDLAARMTKAEAALAQIEDAIAGAPDRGKPGPTRARKAPTPER